MILFILAFCFSACSDTTDKVDTFLSYTDFDELDEEYGVSDAIQDQCVVFEDDVLTSGENIWLSFLDSVEAKVSCNIRIARYYTEDNSFYLIDLIYKDDSFSVTTNEGLSKKFQHLNHYIVTIEENNTTLNSYILMNDANMTYEEYERRMASSLLEDSIESFIIYSVVS